MPPTPFTQRLLDWHHQSGRKDLPWQTSLDAYGVWVSEIMLQQTQVQTVIPYYERFMQRFPSIKALAEASEDDVLHHWSGLGYYARARNLHKAAQIIQSRHQGVFPNKFNQVLALPGIGRSTAGAILAFAFQQRHPILDGNVKRVLCRYHGIEGYPGVKLVETQLWQLADQHTPNQQLPAYTQAIMDLGATCCTRAKPHCLTCPQKADCFAFNHHQTDVLPHRKPKPSFRKKKSVFMLVIADQHRQLYLIKRPASGIWGSLYCFPELESRADVDHWLNQHINADLTYKASSAAINHRFTHFDLVIQPLYIKLIPGCEVSAKNAIWFDPNRPQPLGLPTPVQTIIDTL